MVRVFIVLSVVLVAVMLYGLFDCIARDRSYVRIMPKWAWGLVIMLVPGVGVFLWWAFGRSSFKPRVPKGPLAPDDDPDFLKRIEEEREAERRRRFHENESRDEEI
ncbi:PLD nuclease N-terminal domain-containing protein [Brevibacterium samyangense]|uniref:PLD nuclease N-terminal domain-containing protein n=1 Tax=Brevibacterium samyangense TaxID=366888 RepID=A0ABN2THU9_9MICO